MKNKRKLMRELEKIIIKDKTLISCDNNKCKFNGDIWWCYLNNQCNCEMYREWTANKGYIN